MIRFCSARKKISLCFVYLLLIINFVVILRYILNKRSWNFLPIGLFTKPTKLKYMLLWTDPKHIPFADFGDGDIGFTSRNCVFTNCYVTANKTFLNDIGMFDVVAFHEPEIADGYYKLPKRRLPHQKYVFASIESSANYPICSNTYNDYFNWTWTYKLDSDLRWGYFIIRNNKNEIVGPKKHMTWLDPMKMDDVSNKIKRVLKNKTNAVAWFVSNCKTASRRKNFAMSLSRYLARYNLHIDIYGKCGTFKCPRETEKECYKLIEKHYYFYLSFENSFSEDYVTEKLLIPLQNNAIPIVYGGADYSRFLPPGSYLDARKLGIANLGDQINELMHHPDKYAEYFKWKNYYSFHKMSESPDTDEYCQMCALMNNEEKMSEMTLHGNLQDWWDPPDQCESIASSV